MGLNPSKGNMYDFVTHTWNTVKGECPHGCSYCYMHRWGKQKPVRFDVNELKTDLGKGNFIFVGSSCDMWADGIPDEWIVNTLDYCSEFDNTYLFQTKNPERIIQLCQLLPEKSRICTTIETNRWCPDIMKYSPHPYERVAAIETIAVYGIETYITIEPILDFDAHEFARLLTTCGAKQINIGADSGNNHLPEPPKEKILQLISELEKFMVVKQKSNLKRLLK